MPYNRQIPDAPIAGSMLPRATDLTLDDILVLIQPEKPIGQKNKSLTLSVLAQFLADRNLQEITLEGANGKTLILNGEGSVFTKPPTAGTLDRLTITEDSDGITIAVTGQTVNRTVKMSQTELSISRTQGGLETKITMDGSGITLSDQERVEGQVVTTERKLSPDHTDIHELQFFNDNFSTTGWRLEIADSTDIYAGNLKLSYTGSASELGRFVLNDKLLALAQCTFEKDVTINADLSIGNNKTLNVSGKSNLHNTSIDGYLGIKQLLLSGAVGGGDGCWVCSAHQDNDFYNQTASTGHLWFVVNDTANTQNVKYGTIGGGGGAISYETVTMPSHSITAFLRMGSVWYHWA